MIRCTEENIFSLITRENIEIEMGISVVRNTVAPLNG